MKIMIYYVNNFRNKDKFTKKIGEELLAKYSSTFPLQIFF